MTQGDGPKTPIGPDLDIEDLDWQDIGLCRTSEIGPQLFFGEDAEPADEGREERAKLVCRQCSVQEECLEFALATNQQYGVWGGTGEKERARIKLERSRQLRRGTKKPLL